MTTALRVDVSQDPMFVQGRNCMKEKLFEEAVDLFSKLLEKLNEDYGEMSLESARVWYEYGNALLTAEEENPSNDLLGSVPKQDGEVPEDEEVGEEEDEGEAAGEEGEGGEEGEEDEDEPEGDVQIAFEALDVARCILAKQDGAPTDILLSDIFMRIGDLCQINSNYKGAVEEYTKALYIREAVCKPYDGDLSGAHFSLAIAHLYRSAQLKDDEEGGGFMDRDPLAEKEDALTHYQKALESIKAWITLFSTDATRAEELEDKKDLADTLEETISSLKEEIEATRKAASLPPAFGSSTTTIGFGNSSSSSSSSSAGVTTGETAFKFHTVASRGPKKSEEGSTTTSASSSSSSSSSSAPAAAAAPVEVKAVQVKRKIKPEDANADANKKQQV